MESRHRKQRSGFTLVELLIALIILGFVAALIFLKFFPQPGKSKTFSLPTESTVSEKVGGSNSMPQ